MTKMTMKDEDVAKAWAAHSQERAKNGGGTFSFNGATIYSYGYWIIARHVEREGKPAVLYTSLRGPSNTTATQMGHVRGAIKGMTVFYVPRPGEDNYTDSRQAFISRAAEELARIARAVKDETRASYRAEAEAIVENGNDYAAFFGLAWRLEIDGEEVKTA